MNVEDYISTTLEHALSPKYLNIEDESHQHNVAPGAQSHFKVTIVCDEFDGKRLIQRHRQVNALLADALAGPVHALALHTYTPGEWEKRQQTSPLSPACRGGEK